MKIPTGLPIADPNTNAELQRNLLRASSKYSLLVQFKVRSEERIAIFIKHDHMQSFSTTHCLRFVLRKRYAWRLRRSCTTKYTNLQGCLELYWSRIRKVDNKINLIKKQEHPQTTKAHRTEVTGKPLAAKLTIEYQAYFILQSNNRTRIAKKRSNSWFSRSRITRTRSLSCRTWIRRGKLTGSAKSRKSWSPTWAMPRSSSFAKPLARNNAQIVIEIVNFSLCIVHVWDI